MLSELMLIQNVCVCYLCSLVCVKFYVLTHICLWSCEVNIMNLPQRGKYARLISQMDSLTVLGTHRFRLDLLDK